MVGMGVIYISSWFTVVPWCWTPTTERTWQRSLTHLEAICHQRVGQRPGDFHRDGVLKHGEDVGETNPKNPIFDSTYMMWYTSLMKIGLYFLWQKKHFPIVVFCWSVIVFVLDPLSSYNEFRKPLCLVQKIKTSIHLKLQRGFLLHQVRQFRIFHYED